MLQVEFGLNAEAQKFLSKSGKTLAEAVSTFTSDMNTLVNKTIEDTMINAKQYEAVRWVGSPFLFPVHHPWLCHNSGSFEVHVLHFCRVLR